MMTNTIPLVRLDDPVWTQMPTDGGDTIIWYDNDGVFLSVHYAKVGKSAIGHLLQTTVPMKNAVKQGESTLKKIVESKYASKVGHTLIECQCHDTNDGSLAMSFLCSQSTEGQPMVYFADVMILPSTTDHYPPIEFTLWAQEDIKDVGIRQNFLANEMEIDDQTSSSDPFSRKYDDIFVFHALSKVRQRMDSIPNSVSILI